MSHEAGSLPDLVEKLVKNWEVEASFKKDLKDWRTIDQSNYSFSVNGGPPQSGEHMLKVGTYNALIEPNEYYCPFHSDFAAATGMGRDDCLRATLHNGPMVGCGSSGLRHPYSQPRLQSFR